MMLGRLASRIAASGAVNRGFAGVSKPMQRNFASQAQYNVAMPKVLTTRTDSLMFQCVVAALIYFVPQDVVFLGCVGWIWHSKASSISPCKRQLDAAAAVEEFKAKKGLDKVSVSEGRTWHVSLN
eukprot:TRINITY_DN17234_c0_g1_i1.p1 TRINITY_DN17234_c0_g1~~TRINITY_DN17234_c0_g1_i1.p1  ORF type:complete len:125 (-),score=35.03 TRINITY_DN17234_c0_g1_i1:162-536(-)